MRVEKGGKMRLDVRVGVESSRRAAGCSGSSHVDATRERHVARTEAPTWKERIERHGQRAQNNQKRHPWPRRTNG